MTPAAVRTLYCDKCHAWTAHTRKRDEWKHVSWYECKCGAVVVHLVVCKPAAPGAAMTRPDAGG